MEEGKAEEGGREVAWEGNEDEDEVAAAVGDARRILRLLRTLADSVTQ